MTQRAIFRTFCACLKRTLFVCVLCVFGIISFAHADNTWPFSVTTTTLPSDDMTFTFTITAAGTFYVDCDGGTLSGPNVASGSTINRATTTNNTSDGTYLCRYLDGDTRARTIQFRGLATQYSNNAAISFEVSGDKIASINGNLTKIFPYLESGSRRQPSFNGAFSGCKKITSIPENLFSFNNANVPAAADMFASTFYDCESLTEIPENLFSHITSGASQLFLYTFSKCKKLKSIPAGLFSTITSSAEKMFMETFSECTNLQPTSTAPYPIPAGLFNFGGNYVNGAEDMFFNTFRSCGSDEEASQKLFSLPGNLFSHITSGAKQMFDGTFWGVKNLQSVPGNLFNFYSIVDGAEAMFGATFLQCTNLTLIPETLFSRVKSSAPSLFSGTFGFCSNLTSIPEKLFHFDSTETNQRYVAGKNYMFRATFMSCSKIKSIPENLFSHITSGAEELFYWTFWGCSGLTPTPGQNNEIIEPIPENLFNFAGNNNVSGAESMFNGTFSGCTGLKYLPENLFVNVKSPAEKMFYQTFYGCNGFEENNGAATPSAEYNFIPKNLFSVASNGNPGLINESNPNQSLTATDMMTGIFNGASLSTQCPADYYRWTTGYESAWDNQVSCTPCPPGSHSPAGSTNVSQCVYPFSITTTELVENDQFQFYISAAGTFYIDCGTDGTLSNDAIDNTVSGPDANNVWTITRSNTNMRGYHCSYTTAGSKTIKFGGQATGYSTEDIVAAIRFSVGDAIQQTQAQKILSISGSLGQIFGTVQNPPAGFSGQPKFYRTFYGAANMTGTTETIGDQNNSGMNYALPPTLFDGISGAPVFYMFYQTFSNCSSLTGTIPANLFGNVYGQPAQAMFANTFENCRNLTGTIPAGLFSGINGLPALMMFAGTFYGCNQLSGTIPANLFGNVHGQPAQAMFAETFKYCYGLSGTIPTELFSGINGLPAPGMFRSTFESCTGLTEIPSGLFSGIEGAPAPAMFDSTFKGCSKLSGSIPVDLFGAIDGAPAGAMFDSTFKGCSKLTGTIPANLFGAIDGAPAISMFNSTFDGCYKLTGTIPANLFGNLSGAPATGMFQSTFNGCSRLNGFGDKTYVPWYFLNEINNTTSVSNQATSMFSGTMLANQCPADMYADTRTQFNDAGKPWCSPCPPGSHSPAGSTNVSQCVYPFSVTTTELTANNTFQFIISAVGTFYVDCDNGEPVMVINRSDTNETVYTCTYTSGGSKTIHFGGVATGYSTQDVVAAIRFKIGEPEDDTNVGKIASISGSLGQIFGTVENPPTGLSGQPKFCRTFFRASNMMGSIPADLFTGIRGAPATNMFNSTFNGCSSLTGTIPSNLFADIEGVPAKYMFASTFQGCRRISGPIPSDLFAGIGGGPAENMFYGTFSYCDNLSGGIPSDLFAGIEGVPALGMFSYTFQGCGKLTGPIPEGLFGDISGEPRAAMFSYTFSDCGNLTGPIPSGLFGDISGEPDDGMFASTFKNCSKLSGSIPSDLFGSLSGMPATNMFNSTFSGCSGLNKFGDTTYVPWDFLGDVADNIEILNQATGMFSGTQLDNTCPADTYDVTREQFDDAEKPWCKPCPPGSHSSAGSTDESECIYLNVTYNCGEGTGDPWIDANSPYEENATVTLLELPGEHCIAPETRAFSEWRCTYGDDLVIESENGQFSMPVEPVICTAQWGNCDTKHGYHWTDENHTACSNEYTITYNVENTNGVTVLIPEQATFTAFATNYSLAELDIPNGYNCSVWSCTYIENNEAKPLTVENDIILSMPAADVTCNSTCSANTLHLVWNTKGADNDAGVTGELPSSCTYQTGTINLAFPTKTGYDFKGWKVVDWDSSS